MTRSILALVLLLGIAGCSAAGIPNPFERSQPGQIRIEVSNLNFNDATLHVLTGGTRVRLGTVTGKANSSFTVEWDVARDVWMEVNLVGEGVFTTNAVDAEPGAVLQLLIESDSRRTRLIRTAR